MRRFRRADKTPRLGIAPFIDMMFILLIFFLVTASFARPRGVEVERPRAAAARVLSQRPVVVTVTREGGVYFGGRRVDLATLRRLVGREIRHTPERLVVVDADKDASVGRLVDVVDECRSAGARRVWLSAQEE